jgi:hypothetical protein
MVFPDHCTSIPKSGYLAYFSRPQIYSRRPHVRSFRPQVHPSLSSPHFRSPRPPIICYSCGREGHNARDCWQQQPQHSINYVGFDNPQQHSANYIGFEHPQQHSENFANPNLPYHLDSHQLNADAVFSNYYDQNWYIDSGTSSHLTGDSSNLDPGTSTTPDNVFLPMMVSRTQCKDPV